MDTLYIIKECLKMFYICIMTYYVYIKISGKRTNEDKRNIIILCQSVFISFIYTIMLMIIDMSYANIISFCIYGILLNILLKRDINCFIITYIISVIVTYLIYLVATILSGFLLVTLFPTMGVKNFFAFFVIITIAIFISKAIFKIKRLKNGFNFLNNNIINKNIVIITIFFSGIIVLIFSIVKKTDSEIRLTYLFISYMLIGLSVILWIKNEITKHYNKNMIARTIEVQKKEIDEQLDIIQEIKEENFRLAKAIHKYNHRLSALELGIKNTIEKNYQTEFGEELSYLLKETEKLSKDFAEETTTNDKTIPLTKIKGIDNMFKYMKDEANKANINFGLKINESITPLIENTISQAKFETLLGDHLKDAIIAVNASNNEYKSIVAILGIIDGCYEFSVYDTGIEFEIDTLLKLGLEPITTHKATGGSGIGFMTTFETLKECKASLIIEEYNSETTNYTKSVTIRFDGKNEYRIYSYRADDIKKIAKDNRIIIKKI